MYYMYKIYLNALYSPDEAGDKEDDDPDEDVQGFLFTRLKYVFLNYSHISWS